jgi:hypothetical protein
MFVLSPSTSGIAIHFPSGDSVGFKICHVGTRESDTSVRSRNAPSSGSAGLCKTGRLSMSTADDMHRGPVRPNHVSIHPSGLLSVVFTRLDFEKAYTRLWVK